LANLKMLELQGNPISDFSPLAGLKKLDKLHLGAHQIINPGERTPGNRTRERRRRRWPRSEPEYEELERERQELLEQSLQAAPLRKALPNCKIVLDQMFWEHEHAH
jgi:hypothetical protein